MAPARKPFRGHDWRDVDPRRGNRARFGRRQCLAGAIPGSLSANCRQRCVDAHLGGGRTGRPRRPALTEVVDKSARATDTFAIFFSGDGGWATLDAETSKRLAAAGCRSWVYLHSGISGASAAPRRWRRPQADRRGHGKRWDRTRFALLGYSLGADVAPFMANHLDHSTASHLAMLGLLAPGRQAAFQFHLSDWLGQARRAGRSSRKWRPSGRCPWFACMAPTRRAKACVACPRWRATRFVPSRAVITSRATTMASLPRCSPAWD